jgi:DNA-binding beta-propeller fold protein YncE
MRHRRCLRASTLLASALLLAAPAGARSAILLSANDGHTVMGPVMTAIAPPDPHPDTLSVIDLSASPPAITATIAVPASVVGPPTAAWLAPDESWAIVTAATKADPKADSGISPDDRVSVIDLSAKPPRVVQTLQAGMGATTVRVSPDGTLALVCNRVAGTVSIFTVEDKRLTPSGTIDMGHGSGPGGLVFSHDGHTALVSRFFDHQISVLHIDGRSIMLDPRPLTAGVSPYTMDITPDGTLAAVGNMGRNDGDIDTVSLIDMTRNPPRVINTIAVGQSPEGLAFSPDGQYLATALQNGTNTPKDGPGWHAESRLIIWAITRDQGLAQMAEAPVAGWTQGVAFSPDGRTVLVQSMAARAIQVFRFEDEALTAAAPLALDGVGPAAFAQARH